MKTLYKYTSKNLSGWEFVMVQDRGSDGWYCEGNTASTALNYQSADLTVIVKTRKQLKDICTRLDWLGKYSNNGRK